jgi:hypothetical protein
LGSLEELVDFFRFVRMRVAYGVSKADYAVRIETTRLTIALDHWKVVVAQFRTYLVVSERYAFWTCRISSELGIGPVLA